MPINSEIYYDVSTNDFDCGGSNVEVFLVQTDIVKYPTTRDDYVEEIVVYFTKDTSGNYPTGNFILTADGKTTTVIMNEPDRTVLSGTPGTNPAVSDVSTSGDYYEWHFTPPGGGDNESTTLFEFDNGSGPGNKLKVKIKKQTASSC